MKLAGRARAGKVPSTDLQFLYIGRTTQDETDAYCDGASPDPVSASPEECMPRAVALPAARLLWSGLVVASLVTDLAAQRVEPPPLRRRPAWGGGIAPPADSTGATVGRVAPGSAAERAGVKVGDRLVWLDGQSAADPPAFMRRYRALRAGDTLRAQVTRDGVAAPFAVTIPLEPLPAERIPGAIVTYGSVVTDRGVRLRTIVTRPERARGKLPGLMLVGWLSCSSVEIPAQGGDGLAQVFKAIAARSNTVFLRVEKAGVGDSEGDCDATDLDAELAGYRAALDALRRRPDVDSTRIYLFGASIGGALAPVVAAMLPPAAPVRGIIVTGGFAKTWLEHQLEQERRRLALLGRAPGEVTAALQGFAELYTEFLIRKRTPGEVVAERPHLREIWYDAPAHQYGRPARYYHQVQALNVLEAWSAISAPVLILHGEHDWIMSREDQDLVLAAVNRNRPGAAKLVVLPGTGHDLDTFATLEDSFQGRNASYDPRPEREILAWLRAH
ncbi:MAG TPA: alpha/beta hydrolase [Gemmatimonadales bacterium]|nr:alpha/beta hydrolase [Gemmatimonadales bacterium]